MYMVEGELSRGQRGSKYRDSPPEALYAPAEVRIEALLRLYTHQLKCVLIDTACKPAYRALSEPCMQASVLIDTASSQRFAFHIALLHSKR